MFGKNYDTLSEAIAELKKLGYTKDFSILTEKESLVCHLTTTVLSPDDFQIDDFYRFESNSDPGDEMILYAISSKNKNLKGVVVNAYGVYADNASSAIVKKLNTHPQQGDVDITTNIIHYFKNQEKERGALSPKGTCSLCWGRQEYDGKIRTLLKDKQIDVNNHKDSYMIIQDFIKNNIDGIKLKEGKVTECPECKTE
jgi:hypothetical protein